jgi:hypothetical protein
MARGRSSMSCSAVIAPHEFAAARIQIIPLGLPSAPDRRGSNTTKYRAQ